MIYTFRIVLDSEQDVFRDIAIESSSNLEDLHNVIVNSFGFDGREMASFYKSDEKWTQGEEYSLFDTEEAQLMSEVLLEDILDEENKNLLYVYDFFNMWTFFIELKEISERGMGDAYPAVLLAFGELPEEAPEKQFEAEDLDLDFDDDDFDEDYDDEFGDLEFDEDEFNEYHGGYDY